MGDVDGGDAEVLLHLFQLVAQLHPQLGVQVGQGLVHADDGRAGDQGTGDGHPLLLAAGELADRLGQLLAAEVHLPGDLPDPAVHLRLLQLFQLQAKGDVVVDGHGGEQGVGLKDNADAALLNGHMGDVLPLHHHAAGHGLDKAGEGAQGGGLPAAGGAQEGEELPLLHVDVDAVQGGEVAEFDHNVVQANHRSLSLSLEIGSSLRGGIGVRA